MPIAGANVRPSARSKSGSLRTLRVGAQSSVCASLEVRWGGARGIPVSLRPDPTSNPDANPHLAGELFSMATPPGREKMGSPTLQTHQYPILLLPWL